MPEMEAVQKRQHRINTSDLFRGLFYKYVSEHAKETPDQWADNNALWAEFTGLGRSNEDYYIALVLGGQKVRYSFAWRAFASIISPGGKADQTFSGYLPKLRPEDNLLYHVRYDPFLDYAIEAAFLGLGAAWNYEAGLYQAEHWTEVVIQLLPLMKDKKQAHKLLNRLLFRLIEAHVKSENCKFDFFVKIMLHEKLSSDFKRAAYAKLRKKYNRICGGQGMSSKWWRAWEIENLRRGLGQAYSEIIREFNGSFDISILAGIVQLSFDEMKKGDAGAQMFEFDVIRAGGYFINTPHFSCIQPLLQHGLIDRPYNYSLQDDTAQIAVALQSVVRKEEIKRVLIKMCGTYAAQIAPLSMEVNSQMRERREELLNLMK